MWSRRAAIGLPLLAAGCGFRPLYGPPSASDYGGAGIVKELAAVRVGPSYERSGQLLRRGLMRRMEGAAPGTPAKYQLDVSIAQNWDPIGYRTDGTISRIRVVTTGNWVLSTLSVPPQEIGRSGFGYRILDEFDIPDLQFFSADVARENMESRVMERLADEVTRQVALTLRRRQAAAPA